MTDMNHRKRLRDLAGRLAAGGPDAEHVSASECHEIAAEAGVLAEENSQLRDALMDVCDSHATARIQHCGIRAMRAAANETSVPFSLANVEKYALEDRDDPNAWCQNRASDCADMASLLGEIEAVGIRLASEVERLRSEHEATVIERDRLRATMNAPSEVSDQPCNICGVKHRLGEFRPGQRVRTKVAKHAGDERILVASFCTVREWSQMGGSLYYRVHLATDPDVRQNYAPCQLEAAPERAETADLDVARLRELAGRLVAGGPKASHVSASECHEISDGLIAALDALENDTCARHAGQVHGKEAEELRKGIEEIVSALPLVRPSDDAAGAMVADIVRASLQKLLDHVDARDSLAYLESKDQDRSKK